LEPDQLGEYVLVLAIISIFEVLVGDYLLISVIGAESIEKEILNKSLSFGLTVALIISILLSPLTIIFDNPFVFMMAVSLIFRPYNCVSEGLLTRQFQLSKLGFRELTASIISNIVVFSLFLLSINPTFFLYIRYFLSKIILFTLHFPDKRVSFVNFFNDFAYLEFLKPGLRKLSSNLLEVYTSKIDDIIIGQTISRTNLAIYEIGFQFPQTFRTLTIGSIFGYVVGVYRGLDPRETGKFYVQIGLISSIAATGFLWIMLVYGQQLIETLFGADYQSSYYITVAISFSLSIRFMALSNLPLLVSKNESKGSIAISLSTAVVATFLYGFGSQWDIQQIANLAVAVALFYYLSSSFVCTRYNLIKSSDLFDVFLIYSIFTIPAALFAIQSDSFNSQITMLTYILGMAYIVKSLASKESIITFSKVQRLTNSSENRE
jgi:O-antigen/teichoic acid export membrane protein